MVGLLAKQYSNGIEILVNRGVLEHWVGKHWTSRCSLVVHTGDVVGRYVRRVYKVSIYYVPLDRYSYGKKDGCLM